MTNATNKNVELTVTYSDGTSYKEMYSSVREARLEMYLTDADQTSNNEWFCEMSGIRYEITDRRTIVDMEATRARLLEAKKNFINHLKEDHSVEVLEKMSLVELRDLREDQLDNETVVECVALPSGGVSRRMVSMSYKKVA
jgi:hypothetical protein